ncbi:hypothetical protein [Marinomonas sp. PE14-40]|uniref:hypothetical protein n=1 Tax=Marinomonas sp. PE14-40 TaxID=3060621 RepID=UPI003F666C4A
MLHSSHDTDENFRLTVQKPTLLCIYIVFFALMICHCFVAIMVHCLDVMPRDFANQAFFNNTSFLVKFIGNISLASLVLISLYQMKQSAIFWCLTLLVFDISSITFWVFTQNWLEVAGSLGITIVSIVWSGCLSCFIYLKYLDKQGKLS